MAKGIREREFQNRLIEWSLPLGWQYTPGRKLPRANTQTVLEPHLRDAIVRLNADVIGGFDVDEIVGQVTATVNAVEGGLVAANERVLRLLRGRKEFRNADGQWVLLRFVDLDDPASNALVVSDEVTISVPGQKPRRFDVVHWVNGLPVVVTEVKAPTADSTWRTAATEINDVYAAEYPWFFTPNVFCLASDGVKLRFGGARTPTNLWQPFRSTLDPEDLGGMADVQRSVELLLHPANVLDLLANFCLFDTAGGGVDRKYLPRYPQKEAAHLIHERVVAGGERGLIWHHQGSGKTLLMVFAASLLLNDARTDSPTIILLSDRTQLVRQTAGVFTSAMGSQFFHEPASGAELHDLLARDVRGVISTTVHKFADAGPSLTARSNVVVMIDEAHRTQEGSLGAKMRAALPNAKYFGMTGTPIRDLTRDTFALFGDPADPRMVMHHYSVTRSLRDEATVPVLLEPRPVGFDADDEELQRQFDEFAATNNLDDADKATLTRKFGRLTSVFTNPDRIEVVCQDIVDHYLAGAYRNGMKAQVVTYNRELAVAYTAKINELLGGFEAKQVLADVGRHEVITAEVNISVADSKDEDPALRGHRLSEADEETQKLRFLTPDDPLCFLVVTAKLMTGFDAPNEGVLYLDKPLKAHNLFQTITRPNRTWVSPSGFIKTQGAVVDYIGLAEEVQKAVADPSAAKAGGGFVLDVTEMVDEFRAAVARLEDLFADADDVVDFRNDYATVRAISTHLDENPDLEASFKRDYRLLAKVYPYVHEDKRLRKFHETFRLFGSVYITFYKQSTDEERKERLGELGPMVLDIINANVHSFEVRAAQEESLVLDALGIAILKELMAIVPVRPGDEDEGRKAPSASDILDRIKAALDAGVDEQSGKYVALAKRIRELRERIIQGANDALEFLADALKVAKAVVEAAETPEAALVVDDDHIGVLSRIIEEHSPTGLSVTERRLAEEIDEVVTKVLTHSYDNAEERNKAVRRSAAAVFRRYQLKPVGEPYDSTVEYVEAHYLVD
jgi:type I restriction enzyme R subunit